MSTVTVYNVNCFQCKLLLQKDVVTDAEHHETNSFPKCKIQTSSCLLKSLLNPIAITTIIIIVYNYEDYVVTDICDTGLSRLYLN